jgi:hypothetical protein
MRVVLGTEILISVPLIQTGNPAAIYRAWREGHFNLLTSREHVGELLATRRVLAIARRIKAYKARGLGNELKKLADCADALPRVSRSERRSSIGFVRSGQSRLSGDRQREWFVCAPTPQSYAHRLRARLCRTLRRNLSEARGMAKRQCGSPIRFAGYSPLLHFPFTKSDYARHAKNLD